MAMSTYITKIYDRLDRICYDRYGSTENDLVLFVIKANPGLEECSIILPPGLKISLPDAPVVESVKVTTGQIFLWS